MVRHIERFQSVPRHVNIQPAFQIFEGSCVTLAKELKIDITNA